MELDEKTIRLRPIGFSDIDPLCDYWYRSPQALFDSMGVMREALPMEIEMRRRTIQELTEPKDDRVASGFNLVIEHLGMAIGVHPINELVFGESGVFHAHIWEATFRGKGIAFYTYPRAAWYFVQRFHLKTIIFETPMTNIGPNRVKEKLGLKPLRQKALNKAILRAGTQANVYEWPREDIEAYLIGAGVTTRC